MKKLLILLIFAALILFALVACEDFNNYGVLRIEVWDSISSTGPGDGWHIFINGEYVGRPLECINLTSSGIFIFDFFEKTVTVGDHTISGYWQTDVQTPMAPQTVFVGVAGLTFIPSKDYQ